MSPILRHPMLITISKKLNCLSSYIPSLPDPQDQQEKKKVLLIKCHPVPESYSNALASAAEKGLKSAGHEVRIRNLYGGKGEESYGADAFPAALTTEERRAYLDTDRATEISTLSGLSTTSKLANEVKQAAQDLRWCSAIVFVFPTWWYSPPAVLKGWFDRVLVGGVAFKFPQPATPTSPATTFSGALSNVKKIGVITTYGSPFWTVCAMVRNPHKNLFSHSLLSTLSLFSKFIFSDEQGDNSRGLIGGALRQICAPGCLLSWNGLYNMDFTTQQDRVAFLEHVENTYKLF